MRRIILFCVLAIFGQELFSQKGYYVIQVMESKLGIDSIHFYIDENCFFGRRKRPGLGTVSIGGKTGSLDMDNYCFIDFKSGKIKNYIIPRDENKILIINQDPKFWSNIEQLADIFSKEMGLDANCKQKSNNTPLVTEKNKNIKPPKPDTAYIISCTEIKQAENSLTYTGISTKTCEIKWNTGKKETATIASDIVIPQSLQNTGMHFRGDILIGALILDSEPDGVAHLRTIYIKEFTIKEQAKQRLLSAEYDAEIIGLIQYILNLSVP